MSDVILDFNDLKNQMFLFSELFNIEKKKDPLDWNELAYLYRNVETHMRLMVSKLNEESPREDGRMRADILTDDELDRYSQLFTVTENQSEFYDLLHNKLIEVKYDTLTTTEADEVGLSYFTNERPFSNLFAPNFTTQKLEAFELSDIRYDISSPANVCNSSNFVRIFSYNSSISGRSYIYRDSKCTLKAVSGYYSQSDYKYRYWNGKFWENELNYCVF